MGPNAGVNNCVTAPDGSIVSRSRNLAGLIRYLGKADAAIAVHVTSYPNGAADLAVDFASGNGYLARFADRSVLMHWITGRRNLRGVALFTDGRAAGNVGAAVCAHAGDPVRIQVRRPGGHWLVTECRHCGENLSRERAQ